MGRLSYVIAVASALTLWFVAPALAGVATYPVPEPTTLSLLSGGVALAVVGVRWLRRK